MFIAGITIVPVYSMVVSSLEPLQDMKGPFHWLPSHLTFSAYSDMWTTVPLLEYFKNSVIVSSISTLISIAVAVLAAYAISRYAFIGRDVFRLLVLSTQMFPGILFLLPLFIIFIAVDRSIGLPLYGSYVGLIITYLTFALPFSIWTLVGYFNTVPHDLEEAALVDGATRLGALWHVVIPASVPGIVAVGIFAFMTAWGEVLFASVLTTDTTRTLPIGLQTYASQTTVYWN